MDQKALNPKVKSPTQTAQLCQPNRVTPVTLWPRGVGSLHCFLSLARLRKVSLTSSDKPCTFTPLCPLFPGVTCSSFRVVSQRCWRCEGIDLLLEEAQCALCCAKRCFVFDPQSSWQCQLPPCSSLCHPNCLWEATWPWLKSIG